jgi:hypothetical protein
VLGGIIVAAVFVTGVLFTRRPASQPAPVAATSAPSTMSSSAPASKPAPIVRSYVDVIRAAYPDYPATQPLTWPAPFDEAARFVFNDPLYLERPIDRGDLWITRADAPPLADVLKDADKQQVHVCSETVVFSHWSASPDGSWHASVVCRNPGGTFELASEKGRWPLPRAGFDWPRALTWNDRIVVPADAAAYVIRTDQPAPPDVFTFYESTQLPGKRSSVVVLEDARGLIAWMPWEAGKTGSRGAARYVDGKWTKLDRAVNWPEKILHLLPLRDGSVVQLLPADDGSLKLALVLLDNNAAPESGKTEDPAAIEALVDQLSAPEQSRRDAAYAELSQFGSGAFAVLERLLPAQSPAAQVRIKALLKSGLAPTLGGMSPLPGPVQTVARNNDGGAVFYLDAGVTLPGPQGEPQPIAPVWLSLRPGRAAQILSDFFTEDLQPGKQTLTTFGDEWIISDESHGPRRFMSNHFQEMLKTSEARFSEFVGFDRRGRWVFRTPAQPHASLVIDPTMADGRAHLPIWNYPVKNGTVGWTADNWPVIERGGAWVLGEKGWRPLEKDHEKMISQVVEPPEPAPATQSTSAPAATKPDDLPILVDKDGTRYFDGLEHIRAVSKDGKRIDWPLPENAVGTGDVWFFHAGDDRFFLFNESGRVIRLKRQPDGPEPFRIEAIFARNIPPSEIAARIWLDPAGRIVIAHNGDTLTILFPGGQVPTDIAKLMPNIAREDD